MDVIIEAVNGDRLALNEFQPGTIGRVAISMHGLIWDDGMAPVGVLNDALLYVTDRLGRERRVATEPSISGKGMTISPWRVSFSVPSHEFGTDTERARLSFEVLAVPEPVTARWLVSLLGLLLARSRWR